MTALTAEQKRLTQSWGGSWSREDRPRSDPNPTETKWRWITFCGEEGE